MQSDVWLHLAAFKRLAADMVGDNMHRTRSFSRTARPIVISIWVMVTLLTGGTFASEPSDNSQAFDVTGLHESAESNDGLLAQSASPGTSPEAARIPAYDLRNGEDLYMQTCLPCHGDSGQGGYGGGAPLTDVLTVNDIVSIVSNGQNMMPEFGSVFSQQEIRDVANFIVEELLKF